MSIYFAISVGELSGHLGEFLCPGQVFVHVIDTCLLPQRGQSYPDWLLRLAYSRSLTISSSNPEKSSENFLALIYGCLGREIIFFTGDVKQKKSLSLLMTDFFLMERPCSRIKPAFKSITVTWALTLFETLEPAVHSLTPPVITDSKFPSFFNYMS